MGYEELLRRIFDEVINEGDLDAADELFTEDFVGLQQIGALEQPAAPVSAD